MKQEDYGNEWIKLWHLLFLVAIVVILVVLGKWKHANAEEGIVWFMPDTFEFTNVITVTQDGSLQIPSNPTPTPTQTPYPTPSPQEWYLRTIKETTPVPEWATAKKPDRDYEALEQAWLKLRIAIEEYESALNKLLNNE